MRPNIVGPRHNLPILRPSLSQTPNCAEPARIFPLPQARPSTRPSTCSLKHVRKRKSDATCTSMGRDAGISHFRASQYQGHCNQTYQEDCSRRNLPSLLPPVTICLRRVGYTTRTSDVPVACRTTSFRWLLVCVIWWRGHGLSQMRLAAPRRRPGISGDCMLAMASMNSSDTLFGSPCRTVPVFTFSNTATGSIHFLHISRIPAV